MNARDPSLPLQADEAEGLAAFAARTWDEEIVPALTDYIAVPAKSPMFDPEWERHGLIDRVVRDAAAWVESKSVAGLKLEVLRLPGRTPVIFFEVPATKAGSTDTVCMYGHLDKQPEFNGWRSDLGPWTPKLEDGRLYGRGGADDGYAVYAAITAILALDRKGIPRPRVVGLIESCEESGSGDLPAYIDLLRPRLGNVSLVVCLDSGAGNYDQLWLTTSLRYCTNFCGLRTHRQHSICVHDGADYASREQKDAVCARDPIHIKTTRSNPQQAPPGKYN